MRTITSNKGLGLFWLALCVLSVLGALTLLAVTPLGSTFAAWSRSASLGLAPLPHAIVSVAVFSVLVVAALALASLPSAVYARRASGRTPDAGSFAGAAEVDDALLSHFQWALAAWPIVFAAALVIESSVWLTGSWWWLLAGGVSGAALVMALHGAPGVIARLSGARPVEQPSLIERLGVLARQVRVPIASIDELPVGASVTSTALVSGAGASRRVFLAAEVVRHWSEDEIAVVVAHELAHHAHHDLWRTLALDVVILSIGLLAGQAVLSFVPGLAGRDDLAALPVIALAALAVWLLATPLRHAESRRQERRADRFALELTGHADAFAAAIRRLGARHLAEERPTALTRWFYHRHPSVSERLALAETYRASAAE